MAEANMNGVSLGSIIKFSKGDWTKNEKDVSGEEFIARINDAAKGWVRWEDGKATRHLVGFIRDRFQCPDRIELGDNDQDQWQADKSGKPKDPWSMQWYLPLVHLESGEECVWIFQSHGARGAFSKLLRAYASHRRRGVLPVITLQSDHYKHDDFGRIDIPVLRIERWEKDGGLAAEPEIAPPRREDPISTGPIKVEPAKELNDSIPF
jgi:hypothetical protein